MNAPLRRFIVKDTQIPSVKIAVMKNIQIPSAKIAVVFRPGELPRVDPANPIFNLTLGRTTIECRINAKSARKLAIHPHGAVLQGRLVETDGRLALLDAGFQWLEPKPAPPPPGEPLTAEEHVATAAGCHRSNSH